MDDVKMSEEESINETDSDDSSESVDEEIKLSQNFINTLQKISSDAKNYDDYILLLDIAHDLNDLDKIRQSIELFSTEFPLSPEIWLRYLKTEVSVAQTPAELDGLIKIFKKALDDYYSIDVALEFASIAARCSDEQAKDIWDILLPAYGYEFTKGRLIWQAWRNDYMQRETNEQEKARKIIKKFKEELLLPLKDMQLTYVEFRTFLDNHGHQLPKPFDREAFEVEVKDTKKILQKVSPFEKKLSELDVKAHLERVETFKNYINECADLEEEYVQILYERMLTSCCLNESIWKLYVNYLQNRSTDWKPLESNKSKIFLQTDLDIVNRGLRNCTWSAELYVEKMRILEIKDSPRKDIQNVLEQATQLQYNSPEPLVKIWIEYLTYLTRVTNFKDEKEVEILRNNFNLGWNTLGWQFGSLADCDCEILKFWGRVEYSKMNDCGQGRQLWNTAMESNENYLKAGLWIEFAQLEHEFKGVDAARAIFKRAFKVQDLNDVQTLASHWMRFERCFGTVQHLKYSQNICDEALKKFNRKLKKQTGMVKKSDTKRKIEDDSADKQNNVKKTKQQHDPPKAIPQPDNQPMEIDVSKDNVRIFLSNLDATVTLDDLREALPEVEIIDFKMKGSKGKCSFGYAELSSESQVKKALGMDRRMLGGRPVFISECARDKSSRPQGFKYSTNIEPKKVFVKGLSYSVENEDLRKLFSNFGKIVDVRIVTNKFGKKKGCAYIEYEDENSAKKAVMKADQIEFMDKKITVAISEPPSHDAKVPPTTSTQSGSQKFQPRAEQKSRISLIPAALQKSNLSSTTAPSQPAMSNDDFRKLITK